jgi:hypothetical protein
MYMLLLLQQTSLGIFCCNVPGFEVGLRVLSRFSIVTCFPTGIIAVRVLEKSGDISGRRRREGNPGAGSSSGLRYSDLMDCSTLAAAMVFTAPGIPMLFQGQEFLEGGWFRDTVPVDWDQRDEFHGIVRLYRDLIRLRLNRDGFTRGLCGQFTQVYHLHDGSQVIAFHRWEKGGPADDVVVVANFSHEAQDG